MAKGIYTKAHVNQLMLDPNNYRFIDNKDYIKVNEENISDSKVQNRSKSFLTGKNEDNISDLVASFKANGILKLDPIQVRAISNGNYLVIEGNRRTAALKFLYDELTNHHDVGILTDEDFSEIDIILVDDESPAQHLVTMGLHHISGKKKWSPVNQAQLIYDLIHKYNLTEEAVGNSLAITKHILRRSLRSLALIERYKRSDYGDQFETNKYSVFEEIIKNVKIKEWLQWDDSQMQPVSKINEERLFSWISKEEFIERNDDGDEQTITKEPIITKSHEIRELADFIYEPKAIQQMEESRSISAGYILSDAVGESRLKNAIDNIGKEVQTAFQFSEYMTDDERTKALKVREKFNKLFPGDSSSINLVERTSPVYFNHVAKHFTSINITKYRKLQNIQISNLNRVNLFVGGNNSGKTTMLEMFYLFTRLNNFQSLIDLEKYRGRFYQDFPTKWFDKIFANEIIIEGMFNDCLCSLSIVKAETTDNLEKSHYLNTITTDANVNEDNFSSTIHLFDNKDPEFYFDKSQFLCNSTFSSPYRYDGNLLKKAHAKAIQDKYFDEIIYFIRQKLDNSIEKIEMVSIDNESRFMVTTSKIDHAIDITKYGEGLQRVFEIALLMGYSKNGVICIDELDSAIHKNLLIDFTQFIQETAQKFNVQVFLSTHSKECIDAFVENKFPDDELTAYALSEQNNEVVCKYLEGNKLKQLVESVNIDIR